MVDRINLILKAKNLTSRQFAEEIGIQPSGMSHILSGRNRPSLDFVMKVVTRYPEIDIKWLTLGEGEMYVAPYSMPVSSTAARPVEPVQTHQTEKPYSDSIQSEMKYDDNKQQEAPRPSVSRNVENNNEPDLFSVPLTTLFDIRESPDKTEEVEVESVSANDSSDVEKPQQKESDAGNNEVCQPIVDENRINETHEPMAAKNRNLVKKRVAKVIILYDDHSFSEYYPE